MVKYVTVHGKYSAISDGDWQVFPFTIILWTAAPRSLTKGELLKINLVPFLCRCIKTMRTNPSYPVLPYLALSPEYSSCFGLIWDRGGGRHCHNVFRKVEVGSVVVSIALLTALPLWAHICATFFFMLHKIIVSLPILARSASLR